MQNAASAGASGSLHLVIGIAEGGAYDRAKCRRRRSALSPVFVPSAAGAADAAGRRVPDGPDRGRSLGEAGRLQRGHDTDYDHHHDLHDDLGPGR